MKRANIEIPERVAFVPIDFARESIQDALVKAGYENQKRTLFIWEGVTYYLDAQAVDETLTFVSQCTNKESAIAFDYAISVSPENSNRYGVQEFVQSMKQHHQDESILFSIDEGKTETFLGQRGLEIVEHLDNQEIERELLTDEKASLIGRIPALFRFVMARPSSQ